MEKLLSGKLSIDLASLAKQSIEVNAAYGYGLDVRFVFGFHPEKAIVIGDANRMMQVIANLLTNAAKFSSAGQQELRIMNLNHLYRLEVEDHGTCVPQAFRDQIFGVFAQANYAESRQREGSGLGLSTIDPA